MTQWINDPQGREEIEKVTKELKLPVWKANYKGKFRDFWNELWDKIEDGYLRLKENIAGKEPTILKKSGFNLDKTDSFEEDDTNKLATAKALKKLNDNVSNHSHDDRYYTETEIDNKLSEDIFHNTGKEYGGILNYSGNKIAGKTYFDNNTKKLFLCLKNNNNTSANTENFIPLDNNSLLDRLENLSKNTYIVLKNSSLRQALIETLNTNINLINMPEPNTIPELRDIIEKNTRVEAFKIINNNYAIRWLIWGGENLYYAFMWNSSTNLKITKIG